MHKIASHDLDPGMLNKCQICGNTEIKQIVNFGHLAPCDSLLWPEQLGKMEPTYPLNLVRCQDCGLVQINYAVDPAELFFPSTHIEVGSLLHW